MAKVTTEREKGWNLENSWQGWSRPGCCKKNIQKIFKIRFDLVLLMFKKIYIYQKKCQKCILLNHIELFLSFNLFFFCTSPNQPRFQRFWSDPWVSDKCWNYGNFALNCTHFWKLHTFLQVETFVWTKSQYFFCKALIFRSSHWRCSIKRSVLRNFATLLKERLWHRCFPVNFEKLSRSPFSQNTSGQLHIKLFWAKDFCQISKVEWNFVKIAKLRKILTKTSTCKSLWS